jgi:potassium efflux system protein
MRCFLSCRWLAVLLVLWQPLHAADPAGNAEPDGIAGVTPALVTADIVKSRLKEIETSTSLDETARATLTETLNKVLGNLEAATANQAAADAYAQAVKAAPQQTKAIREQLEQKMRDQPEATVTATADSPFAEIEAELLQEKANLAAVEARLADMEAQLEASKGRPTAVQQQLAAAKRQRQDLESRRKLPAITGESPWVAEARAWVQATGIAALRNEVVKLDQELLSLPMRIGLLEAQRDDTLYTVERIKSRIKQLEALASQQGRAEAELAEVAARAAVYGAAGKHPLVQELAEQNVVLTGEISTLAADLKRASAGDEVITGEAKRIEELFRTAREKLEVAGLTEVLGEVLLQQRKTLPDQSRLGKKIRQLEQENAKSALRQIQYESEFKLLRSIDDYVKERVAGLEPDVAEQVAADLEELAGARRLLLDKAISISKSYSRELAQLEAVNRRLLGTTADFDNFLAEKLLWIRSAPKPNLTVLQTIPGQVIKLLYPGQWFAALRLLVDQIVKSPLAILLLVMTGGLLLRMRRMLVLLRALGAPVGKPSQDKFSFTLKALGLTLLLALPLPLLLMIFGWVLGSAADASQFSRAVASAMLQIAPTFLYLQFFSIMCVHGGVAEKHYHWPEPLPRQLRRGFRRMMVLFLPTIFILVLLLDNERQVMQGGLERVLMTVALVVIAVFFYRLSRLLIRYSIGSESRLRYLWLGLTVAAPLVLAVVALAGYIYTAGKLGSSLLMTLWFVFGLVILHQLIARWLLLTQRRLALQAIRERMRSIPEQKAPAGSEMAGMPALSDETEFNLADMSEESRKLLNTLLVIIGIVGTWLIWSEILPAFSVLDEVVLWHHTVVVDGEQAIAPVTLADIGLAILIAIVSYVAMKRFPALLEIVLLQRVNMTSGARYTVTTLTTYVIVGIGLVAFFRVIGADWSKLQWLFAALGVGIGFGLQEIVANFISGLIILFERPIRVGDVVTIGDTDGMVTRIQIRATTIRTWDRQELLVPNKEFITGRLLNWSLSDQTTRIKVPVGVAYGSDVQLAMALMNEAAQENEHVLADPEPSIIFNAFGDNALNLVLRCFVGTQDVRMSAITELHEAINRKFSAAGICIAFPQRDVHLDTTRPLEVHLRKDAGAGDAAT